MQEIVKIRIQNELDIVMAYKRAKQLSEYTGMNISNQTKFSTAVSEICRNVLEHVGEGNIVFAIVEEGQLFLQALISDHGRGIVNIEEILNRKFVNVNTKGCGIVNSNKLVDQFNIDSNPNHGTKVRLRKKISPNHPPINQSIVQGWKDYFLKEFSISPYDEIKKQNTQLVDFMDNLRIKNLVTEAQMAEIRRLNSDLDKFAYTVSHDLKSPLQNIEAIITMIEDSLTNGDIDDAKKSVEILKSQTTRMDLLIRDILFYSKEGKKNIVRKKIDLFQLVNEVIYSLNIPNEFQIKVNPNMPVLITEEVLLNQIFSNIIGNAVKYHDRKEGNIFVDFKINDSGLTFSVQDDGPGISENDFKKIFKLFNPLKTKDGSTGIGLSIVEDIVTEKGGKVWVESCGRGAKVLFTWPESELKI